MSHYRAQTGKYEGAMTFQEIARRLGISRQLVWFYYVSALRKLRRQGTAVDRLHALALEAERMREARG